MRPAVLTWLGLILLVAGSMVGLFPHLPATTLAGVPMQGVPHWPPWTWGGVMVAGVLLLLWGRSRESC